MKKLLIILVIILMFGCESRTEEQIYRDYRAKLEKARQDSIRKNRYNGFDVIVIDSCEYLIKTEERGESNWVTRSGYMSHKGNCKFCEERRGENKMKEKILNWITENIDSYIMVDEESAKIGFSYQYIDTQSLKYDLGKFIDSIEGKQ